MGRTRTIFLQNLAHLLLVAAVGLTFVLGIVMVWLYALIRPRMGPGPKTAIVAALVVWFGIYVYMRHHLRNAPGSADESDSDRRIVWGLVEYVVAAIAGAGVYKEA